MKIKDLLDTGPTNFSAVFMENRENLGNDEIQISVDSEPYVPSYESLQSQTFLMLAGKEQCGSPRVALGTKVLHALPDEHTCKFLLEWWFEKCHECTMPKAGILALANSVWTTFGKGLKEPRFVIPFFFLAVESGSVAGKSRMSQYFWDTGVLPKFCRCVTHVSIPLDPLKVQKYSSFGLRCTDMNDTDFQKI